MTDAERELREFYGLARELGRTPIFASGPDEALHCQMALSLTTRRMMSAYGDDVPGFNSRDTLSICRLPVVWFNSDTAAAIRSASETFPLEDKLHVPEMMSAFAVFQDPVLDIVIDGVRSSLSGISWQIGQFINRPDRPISMSLKGYVWLGGSASVVVSGSWPDVAKGEKAIFEDADDDIARFARFVLSASMFMSQRIAVASRAIISRATTKQAKRAGIEADVKVITLRRREAAHGDSRTGIEYSCRWLVSGHWRKQFYPKAGRHVPVWIDAHIKGPEGMPMKSPKPTVFAVTR